MDGRTEIETSTARNVETCDVLIIGAGISGIGAAYHLTQQCPSTTFVILEAQESFGGTWRTHRFPGIRSDSDLYTFGYRFKPWIGPPIATADRILAYMGEVIDENGLGSRIRYRHAVSTARWSSESNRWTVTCRRGDTGEPVTFTAKFLWMCQGYYNHAEGHMPKWSGMERFQGPIVHPQNWPEDLDYRGKNVVVIGSGATAATIIPAMAPDCRHITMLQRSPTYFHASSNAIPLADELRRLKIKEEWIHEIVRQKILHDDAEFERRTFAEPEVVKAELLSVIRAHLGEDYDVDTHFTPRYRPWRQRLAVIPEGDLLKAIRAGQASVVTDEIDSFTETGIVLKSGRVLDADIVVAATGLNICVFGDIEFAVDGRPLDFSETVGFHGMMFTGVPNMAWVFGYIRSSWTLRVDLIADFVCRLLGYMDEKGFEKVVPMLRPEDRDMRIRPWIEPENFNPNYILRSLQLPMPRCGDKPEWQHSHDYWIDKDRLPAIEVSHSALVYS